MQFITVNLPVSINYHIASLIAKEFDELDECIIIMSD